MWLFCALALAVTLVPSASAVRVGGLADGGRLLGRSARDSGRRRTVAWGRLAAAVGLAAVASIVVFDGVAIAVAVAAVLATVGVLGRDVRTTRATARRHRELLTAVGVLGGELTAGARPAGALRAAAGTSPAMEHLFGPAADAAARGGDAAELLVAQPDVGVRTIGLAWRLVDSTGAGLTGVIERVAADLADRDTQRRTVAVALAGPRSSAMLLSSLPALGIGLGAAMGAAPVPFLLGDPIGRLLCCVGILLDVAGVFWMRRIVGRVQDS